MEAMETTKNVTTLTVRNGVRFSLPADAFTVKFGGNETQRVHQSNNHKMGEEQHHQTAVAMEKSEQTNGE